MGVGVGDGAGVGVTVGVAAAVGVTVGVGVVGAALPPLQAAASRASPPSSAIACNSRSGVIECMLS